MERGRSVPVRDPVDRRHQVTTPGSLEDRQMNDVAAGSGMQWIVDAEFRRVFCEAGETDGTAKTLRRPDYGKADPVAVIGRKTVRSRPPSAFPVSSAAAEPPPLLRCGMAMISALPRNIATRSGGLRAPVEPVADTIRVHDDALGIVRRQEWAVDPDAFDETAVAR